MNKGEVCMPLHLSLGRKKERDESLERDESRIAKWVDKVWILGIIGVLLYFIAVYILPLFRVISTPVVPFKMLFEIIICFINYPID